jgi:hypothetical protein|tara:strand:+ start:849 stop:1088 length:240 start_codon:yes stop_codon:yes gene_type:complete
MNINKIVSNGVKSIKKTYDETNLNPFKVPENINVNVTIDIAGSYKNLFKKIEGMTEKDMKRIANILDQKSKIFMKLLDK